jgi:hypothetical protein
MDPNDYNSIIADSGVSKSTKLFCRSLFPDSVESAGMHNHMQQLADTARRQEGGATR